MHQFAYISLYVWPFAINCGVSQELSLAMIGFQPTQMKFSCPQHLRTNQRFLGEFYQHIMSSRVFMSIKSGYFVSRNGRWFQWLLTLSLIHHSHGTLPFFRWIIEHNGQVLNSYVTRGYIANKIHDQRCQHIEVARCKETHCPRCRSQFTTYFRP